MAGSHARRTDDTAHGHGHGHGHGPPPALDVRRGPRLVLVGSLVVGLLLTVVGLVLLWPDGDEVHDLAGKVQFAAPGVTFPRGEVLSVQEPCAPGSAGADCGQIQVRVEGGEDDGAKVAIGVPPDVLQADLRAGDTVKLIRTPAQEGQDARINYFGTVRDAPLVLLLGLFVVVVLAVARFRGLMALIGLAFATAVIAVFVLPALLSGEPGVLVGMVGSAAIMYVVLYTTHGWSLRTSAALGGTLAGIGLTALIGHLAVGGTRLTGVADEGSRVLGTFAPDLSFQGVFACAIIVAGLGVLNDVTITQASAVWELRAASPTMSRSGVFAAGMRIGRDHIASTIYTIVFAYAGTTLTVLLVLRLYALPGSTLLATEEITQEVVRTLATSIGLVLAVPLTTLIAVATLPPAVDPDLIG
ncbi:YibE/F family protein [Nocardioides rubriscoriae]|uniref:YibE/F family protein n=1 Tax=Nocardioides rubriscoriae TaxID=642762 RepID=UPI0011DF4252|nr:YibE/F family protein [Nocardioides rubriscoriae]